MKFIKRILIAGCVIGMQQNTIAQITKINKNNIARISVRNEATERKLLLSKVEPKEVWFYENSNYQGKKYVLSTGKFLLSNLGATANDFFSSAIIPKNLIVKVFFDDGLKGKWIMLKSDELNNGYNTDFTNLAQYQCGKDNNNDISGTINANDQISSIEIFAPAYDYITIYDDCNYKGNPMRLIAAPTPVPNSPSMKYFVNNGWGNITWFNAQNKAVISSISLHGQVASVDLGLSYDFKNGVKKNVTNDLDCLTKLEFPSEYALTGYNDNLRSIRINLKFGTKTIID